MKPSLRSLVIAAAVGAAAAAATTAWAQQAPKPEQLIKWRQSAYQFLAWNTGRVKANVEGSHYNKDDVVKAANAISAVANSGLGALFAPGTETGKGWHDTTVKPELFTDPRVGELAGNFTREATALAQLAPTGDQAAVKEQFGKLTKTCKACHDDFKNKD